MESIIFLEATVFFKKDKCCIGLKLLRKSFLLFFKNLLEIKSFWNTLPYFLSFWHTLPFFLSFGHTFQLLAHFAILSTVLAHFSILSQFLAYFAILSLLLFSWWYLKQIWSNQMEKTKTDLLLSWNRPKTSLVSHVFKITS